MEDERRRTPLELGTIAGFGVAYFACALCLFVGLPTLAIVRTLQHGLTVPGVLWGTLAVLFLGTLGYALASDRETRGWVMFALLGWLSVFPAIARTLRKLVTR